MSGIVGMKTPIGNVGGGGGGSSTKFEVIGWAYEDQPIDNTVEYATIFGGALSAEILRKMVLGSGGTLKKMTVKIGSSSGETNPIPITLRKNAVDTALTLMPILNTPGIYTVTADVSFTATDELSIEFDNTGNFGGTRITSVTFEVEWD